MAKGLENSSFFDPPQTRELPSGRSVISLRSRASGKRRSITPPERFFPTSDDAKQEEVEIWRAGDETIDQDLELFNHTSDVLEDEWIIKPKEKQVLIPKKLELDSRMLYSNQQKFYLATEQSLKVSYFRLTLLNKLGFYFYRNFV